MRALLLAVIAGLVIALPGPAYFAPVAAKSTARIVAKPAFTSSEQVLVWINGYRAQPEPQRLSEAVQAMSRLGLFRDVDTAGVYIGFIAGVLGDNQLEAEPMISAMFPMPPEEQAVIIKAIAYSGLPDWKARLMGIVERMPARRVLIEKYLYRDEPTLMAVPLKSGPATLDTLWGFYFATGSFAPVQRLVGALPWSVEQKDVDQLTIGSMAKWTLASNAANDKELLDLLRAELAHQPPAAAKPLGEVIAAAEGYETGKIRKDAVAAIEALKKSGPPKESSWGQWGVQAAPTVVALGCVAASVAGQVAVGVPCLVTGALSSAVSKLWVTQP